MYLRSVVIMILGIVATFSLTSCTNTGINYDAWPLPEFAFAPFPEEIAFSATNIDYNSTEHSVSVSLVNNSPDLLYVISTGLVFHVVKLVGQEWRIVPFASERQVAAIEFELYNDSNPMMFGFSNNELLYELTRGTYRMVIPDVGLHRLQRHADEVLDPQPPRELLWSGDIWVEFNVTN